jgi:hypothetical protein
LILWGLGRRGKDRFEGVGLGFRGWGGGFGCGLEPGEGLHPGEGFESFAVGADGGFDSAGENLEDTGGHVKGLADGAFLVGLPGIADVVLPEFGFDAAEAAGGPSGGDEDVHQVALFGGGGGPSLEIELGEGLEIFGFFAADDFALGVNAGLESVHGGGGLALNGAGASRCLRVAPVGVDLRLSSHDSGVAYREAGV